MNKQTFDTKVMNDSGWWCHRKDYENDFEAWHYNYFGEETAFMHAEDPKTSAALERKILAYYWNQFNLTDLEVQKALSKLGMYKGTLDGVLGTLSKESIMVFQRAWMLEPDGVPGEMTKRTLAFVAADTKIS